MWKASFQCYGVLLLTLFVEVSMACKVGVFDVCNGTELHHHQPLRTEEFLYFQNAGDIERMTASIDNMLIEISLVNGSVIHKNHDGLVEIHGANNKWMMVNMSTLEVNVYLQIDGIRSGIVTLNISEDGYSNPTLYSNYEGGEFVSAVSTNATGKNEVTINTSCAVIALQVFEKVFDASLIIRAELMRKTSSNADIRISGYLNTTVYERRNSDDVYLMMSDGDHWEEMYMQPAEFLIRIMNDRGTLYFHPNRPIHANTWNGLRVSCSPFGNKFGNVTEGNVTRQTTFKSDGCSWLEVAELSGSRKVIAEVRPPMLFVIDMNKNASLKIEPHKYFYSNSSRGIVKVDLEKRIVQMEDIGSISTFHVLANETSRWAGVAGSVEHFDESVIEDYSYVDEETNKTISVYKPVSALAWRMKVGLGWIEFPTRGRLEFRFASANNIIANIEYTGDGFWVNDAVGEMSAYCRHFSNVAAGKGSVHVNGVDSIVPPSFLLRNEPGNVYIKRNVATVRAHSGMVTISHF